MLFVKIVGILFLCSLAATDVITFKPFLKSRYSLRARRAKSTTRAPLIKSNDTVLNYSTTEAEIQSFSTVAPTQLLETTKAFITEKQLEDSNDQSTAVNTIIPTTQVTITAAEVVTASVDKISSTSAKEIVNLENEVTDKIFVADTTTTKKIETTTPTEWLYDYYASDDDSPRKETSA